jgi:hypothetical protein
VVFIIGLLIVPLFISATFGQFTEENVPTLECKWASQAPEIDGFLDDVCWQEANWVGGFDLINVSGVPKYDAKVLAVYDEFNLYIAFICYDDMSHLSRDMYFGHDAWVWKDDCVEVFFDVTHNHKDYYHIITNRSGTRYDEIGRLRPTSWDGNWRVGVGYASDHWTVELAIPFRDFGRSTPKPGEVWGINFAREHHSASEFSSWTQSFFTFHQPHNFGHIIFMPFL